MRSLVDLLIRFRDDERGVFAVIFGVMAIAMVAFAGAAVDYTHVETTRARAQIALDSAALGLQPTIFDNPAPTSDQLKARALALLNERLGDASAITDVDVAIANAGNGTLHLEGTVRVNTAFVQLVGIPSLTARIVSEATRKRLNLEVAMVLDNSQSMSKFSRMDNLKKAAKCAMNVLFNALDECTDKKINDTNGKATTEQNIWIGIVPFTGFVNVGPGYKNATWMDTTGLSSIANDNFDDDDNPDNPPPATVNRFNLYTTTKIAWRGCVEARPYPYDTDDTEPTSANPDTLFVPEWAPDTPDLLSATSGTSRYIPNYSTSNSGAGPTVFTLNTLEDSYTNGFSSDTSNSCTNKDLGAWEQVQTKTGCPTNYGSSGNNARDSAKNQVFENCNKPLTKGTTTAKNWQGTTITATTDMPASMPDKNGYPLYPTCYYVSSGFTSTSKNGTYTLNRKIACRYFFSDRVRQERLCKYSATTSGTGSPNDDCPTNPLTPLTSTKSTVLSAINAMSPQGYTNIHQGAIWGYHMLTPTEPLTQAKSFEASTSKVMIIMTDGENTIDGYDAGTGKARTMLAYGYPINGRLFSDEYPNPSSDAEITAAMDSRTQETCTNAKKSGITIYTIGLSAPNQKTIDLLTNCASNPSMAYFPDDPTKLTNIFKEIADQLANLRLSQ